MGLIDKQNLIAWLKDVGDFLCGLENSKPDRKMVGKIIDHVEAMPTVDAVEVVRCNDCKDYSRSGFCRNGNITSNCDCDLEKEPNGYCDWGERRDGD